MQWFFDNSIQESKSRVIACLAACQGMENPESEILALRKDSDYLIASEKLRAKALKERNDVLQLLIEFARIIDCHGFGSDAENIVNSAEDVIKEIFGPFAMGGEAKTNDYDIAQKHQ